MFTTLLSLSNLPSRCLVVANPFLNFLLPACWAVASNPDVDFDLPTFQPETRHEWVTPCIGAIRSTQPRILYRHIRAAIESHARDGFVGMDILMVSSSSAHTGWGGNGLDRQMPGQLVLLKYRCRWGACAPGLSPLSVPRSLIGSIFCTDSTFSAALHIWTDFQNLKLQSKFEPISNIDTEFPNLALYQYNDLPLLYHYYNLYTTTTITIPLPL